MISGTFGPPLPIVTITGSYPLSFNNLAIYPATAVLPIRFPVPITPMEGFSNKSKNSGGSKRKSDPMYDTLLSSERDAILNLDW
ncbi:MAG: hypothetical protein MASP_01113 [Candidatus Methanolliviera sp. GoM_asphalt]|nr:MAG: hypothetical protein MASP_01113 [Candidatus Methanolliviera sp. GoM_asphalt]